jgi:hypothetical protein
MKATESGFLWAERVLQPTIDPGTSVLLQPRSFGKTFAAQAAAAKAEKKPAVPGGTELKLMTNPQLLVVVQMGLRGAAVELSRKPKRK